ncbi:MAG: VOC family protein [Alphaproteobacteria bacterium]|nr:VOC family protein [Alphaproteobacteria bacterium]
MRLNHVTIIVTDFERAKAFYSGLGFVQIVDAPPRYARFMVPGNEATFSIEVTPEAKPMGPEQAHLYFECDDLDATCAALEAKGYVFAQKPTDMDYLWREARLKDPDGHDIRLFHAGKNRLDPPWRLPRDA